MIFLNEINSHAKQVDARAHGYLSKCPVRLDNVVETIAPIWLERFPQLQSTQKPTRGSEERLNPNTDSDTDTLVSLQDLMGTIGKINNLSGGKGEELQKNWPSIWEMLHSMKGDLLTMMSNEEISTAIQIINSIRGPMAPDNFVQKWQRICFLILEKKKDD